MNTIQVLVNVDEVRALIARLKKDRDDNQHTGAVSRLIHAFSCLFKYRSMMGMISYDHGFRGELTAENRKNRDMVLGWALADLKPVLGDDLHAELAAAF